MRTRLLLTLLFVATTPALAQHHRTLTDDEWCDEASEWDRDRETICEVRETVVTTARLDVNAGANGGIKVQTWDRDDVLVRSRVMAAARTEAAARRLLQQTDVSVNGSRVRTDTPETRGEDWVTIGFEIFVPRQTDLQLQTLNGGVAVEGVTGAISAKALNGGIALADVAGAVRARTTNGGVSVSLAGDAWDGEGLDVETTNGGIAVRLPEGYSARLDARTEVGRISAEGISLPRERESRGYRVGDRVETTLGRGGAPLRLMTTNGGVSIRQER